METATLEDLARGLAHLTTLVERLQQPKQLVTVAEAAQQLGVSVPTVRRRIRDGKLVSKRLGRAVRVDLSRLG